jgi:transcriptional regulator with XRE-family HTH domain
MRSILKTTRYQKGLTQKQIANELGITTRMYRYIETGDRNGSLVLWDKLEDILDIPQRQLRVHSEEYQLYENQKPKN